jgi:alkylresorcinol/alkylpyrone synthase
VTHTSTHSRIERRRTATRPPRLAALGTALPRHHVSQSDARGFAAEMFSRVIKGDASRLLAVFDNSGIVSRHICMPLEWYRTPHDFGESNAAYVEQALVLARAAASAALANAGLAPRDVTHLVYVSSTGIATPSIDARLANAAGFAPGVRRVPIWGLGCAGGSAGLARAADFARADPDAVVLMIALELCSLAFQPRDNDARNIVATALFSDGAAAAVVTGANRVHSGEGQGGGVDLEITAAASTLWPDTLDIMGWTVDAHGLHVVFSRDIPSFVRASVRPDLERFLVSQGIALACLDHLVAHPGGPKVLEAYSQALELAPEHFRHARTVLERCGNMSSPTCLFVLEETLAAGDVRAGDSLLLAALGPGFASEYVLLRSAR